MTRKIRDRCGAGCTRVEVAGRAENLRPDPLPGPIGMIVGRLQQRAQRQITASDGDFLEDPVIFPAALQAREAPCGALQPSARPYRGEQKVRRAQSLAGLQREIVRLAAAAAWDAARRR